MLWSLGFHPELHSSAALQPAFSLACCTQLLPRMGQMGEKLGPSMAVGARTSAGLTPFNWRAVIPATVVAAASFDDAIAITGYTLFINLAVRSGGSPVWSVMHGPLSLLFGVLAGILAGVMCSITKLWDNSFKRTLIMFFTSAPPTLCLSSGVMYIFSARGWQLSPPTRSSGPCHVLIVLSSDVWLREWPSCCIEAICLTILEGWLVKRCPPGPCAAELWMCRCLQSW